MEQIKNGYYIVKDTQPLSGGYEIVHIHTTGVYPVVQRIGIEGLFPLEGFEIVTRLPIL